jgi:hypothetical protein
MDNFVGLVAVVFAVWILIRIVRYVRMVRYFASEEFLAHKAEIASVVAEHNEVGKYTSEIRTTGYFRNRHIVQRRSGTSGGIPEHEPVELPSGPERGELSSPERAQLLAAGSPQCQRRSSEVRDEALQFQGGRADAWRGGAAQREHRST